MWRRTAVIIAIVVTLTTRAGSMAQDSRHPRPLIRELTWVRFDVVMGRLVIASSRIKQSPQRVQRELPDGTLERLSVSLDRGLTSLYYSSENDARQLNVQVVRRDRVELRWAVRQPDGTTRSLVYEQEPGQDVSLSTFADGVLSRAHREPSFWHLLVRQPEGTSLFIDALHMLRADWDPLRERDALCRCLLESDPRQITESFEEIQTLVRQLGHEQFHVRQQADRDLRARGRTVSGLLGELDPSQLDSEQRFRLKEIRRAMENYTSDTPQRVAAWLVNDRHIWLALLDHAEPHGRQIACSHLERITNRRINYDPHANSQVRAQQVALIRSELLRR